VEAATANRGAGLPILPTSVIGSYAWPGWVWSGLEAQRRGEFGPADWNEMLDDAVDMAMRDQEDAGVDIISDGEMRRVGFFTAEFYSHLTGVRPLEPERKKGPAGHDQQHRFEVLEPIAAPNGLGVVAEYGYARSRTRKPVKVTLPGPFTLSGRLATGSVYPRRMDTAWAFVPVLNAELRALQEAGADFIQIDEPSPAIHPESPTDYAELFNAAVEGVNVKLAAHLCFGNYVGRPLAKRSYAPVLDMMLRYNVSQLVLEFANRELAELPICAEIAAHKELAVGLIDVKNYYIETPEDVAERIQKVLQYMPAEKLTIVPDCGFSQTARWAARAKLRSMVAGAHIVRAQLG
jgi:5-methyltetrahydropteroyltriglutamate--homocysteine methyltransferase